MKRPGRRGWTDYANVLRVVMDHPGTTSEIAARIGIARNSARKTLNGMRDAGLIFERAWRPCEPTSTGQRLLQAVWSTQGPPAPRPSALLLQPAAPATRMPQLSRFCRAIAALMQGALSAADLADAAGANVNNLRPLLRHLVGVLRLVCIEDWRQRTRCGWPVPIYRWGPGRRNARRPKPLREVEAWRKQHAIRQQRLFWVHMIFMTAGAKPA